MTDLEGFLEHQGPNTRHAYMIHFKGNVEVARLEPVIRAYLAEAVGYAAAGIRPPSDTQERDLPEELEAALEADPSLAQAFHAQTPGRKNSYVVNLNGAKTSSTRTARITKFRDRIVAGKGATERRFFEPPDDIAAFIYDSLFQGAFQNERHLSLWRDRMASRRRSGVDHRV